MRPSLVQALPAPLSQGLSPARLALSVALGIVIGLIPVLGVSTLLCTLAALALRLNLPAVQLVNYLLTPLQVLLVIPQLRLGEWLVQAPPFPITLESGRELFTQGAVHAVTTLGIAILHATLGWLAIAPVVAWLLYRLLGTLFRHVAPAPAREAT